MPKKQRHKIVVIGGGTGTQVVLQGLKRYPIDLAAVISVADSGGSTGRLRDEFGFQPVGDLRQALAALSVDSNHAWIRKLLLYRFSKGSGLEGHNLGNLILTALQDMAGTTPDALEIAQKIFRLEGNIYPVTTNNIQLLTTYEDDSQEIGQHQLNKPHRGMAIKNISTIPSCELYEAAERALIDADVIVIGPGDLYGSILATLLPVGVKQAFFKSKAKVIFVLNLMTRYSETNGMSARQYVDKIEAAIDKKIDYIIMNSAPIPDNIFEIYKKQKEYPVEDNLGTSCGIIREELIKPVVVVQHPHDVTERSYLRHDPHKLAREIIKLCSEKVYGNK